MPRTIDCKSLSADRAIIEDLKVNTLNGAAPGGGGATSLYTTSITATGVVDVAGVSFDHAFMIRVNDIVSISGVVTMTPLTPSPGPQIISLSTFPAGFEPNVTAALTEASGTTSLTFQGASGVVQKTAASTLFLIVNAIAGASDKLHFSAQYKAAP